MARLKLTLEYDGTDFVGWQVQPNGRSVQAVVERALESLLGERTPVVVAGRTDAGVHAEGQVMAFDVNRDLPLKAYLQGLNGLLPPDVGVVKAEQVAPEFDPRRWARGKQYRYLISNAPHRSPLRRRTHWEIFGPLDVEAMKAAAPHLLGRHDFSAFRAANCQAAHAVRELHAITFEQGPSAQLRVTFEGTAFLRHMVRNLVGTLVDVGKGKRPASSMKALLESRDRNQAGMTAPPQGLTLVQVFYGEGPRVASRSETEADDG